MKIPLDLFLPVVTAEAMGRADQWTIDELGLPARILMESAGRAVADAMESTLGSASGRIVLVVCGRGNNGGDGFVTARVLAARGADVRVVCPFSLADLSPDAAANAQAVQRLASGDGQLEVLMQAEIDSVEFDRPHWIVDALVGVGAHGPLRAPVDEWAARMNQAAGTVISIDVPTGLDSDTGEAAEGAVQADLCVGLAALKHGSITAPGRRQCGDLQVVDIGIPRRAVDEAVRHAGAGWMSTDRAVGRMLPARALGVHKYSAGRVLAVAGSAAFPGAAVLCAQAAARAGAGAVVLGTSESARRVAAAKLLEVMTFGLPETEGGAIAHGALDTLLARASSADALLIGPGLGRDTATQQLVRDLLRQTDLPAIIDADGLNALAAEPDFLPAHGSEQWILTPHMGEMKRLVGGGPFDSSRPDKRAAEWARRFGCTLLLKGAPSLVAAPSGDVLFSGISTPATATAGTGDVLAGVIAALVAQGVSPPAAGICALHLTGRAAQHFERGGAAHTMVASDLIEHLPATFLQ